MFKGWRTVIFNVFIVTLTTIAGLAPVIGLWEEVLPTWMYVILATAVPLANIWLRMITTTPVGRKE